MMSDQEYNALRDSLRLVDTTKLSRKKDLQYALVQPDNTDQASGTFGGNLIRRTRIMNPKKELSTLRYLVESAAADVREQRETLEDARKHLALSEEGFEHAWGELRAFLLK